MVIVEHDPQHRAMRGTERNTVLILCRFADTLVYFEIFKRDRCAGGSCLTGLLYMGSIGAESYTRARASSMERPSWQVRSGPRQHRGSRHCTASASVGAASPIRNVDNAQWMAFFSSL